MMIQTTPITQEILDKVEGIAKDMLEERFAADGFIFDPIIVERKIDHYGDEYVDVLASCSTAKRSCWMWAGRVSAWPRRMRSKA